VSIGAAFLLAFFSFLSFGRSPVPTNAVGQYFVGFAASAMIGWGWSLRAAANEPALRRLLAVPTATGMALMGLYRIMIVVASVEVRAWAGWVPAVEAAACAVLAVAFARTTTSDA